MSEQVAWAECPSVAAAIRALTWSESTAYMYLERIPQTFLDNTARQNGLQLLSYAAETCFDTWQRGRVFNAQHEFKWEQRADDFHAVYCGMTRPDGFTYEDLPATRQSTTYYLWGQQVADTDRERLGIPPDLSAFVELQIPRILYYPARATQRRRLRVDIYEFYAADGQLRYARWYGLH